MKEVSPAGDSGLRDGFFFLGNHVALDFVNTRPILDGQPTELLSDFDAWLRWMLAAGLMEERDAVLVKKSWRMTGRRQRIVGVVRGLREALRKDILAWERGGSIRRETIQRLNRILEKRPMLMRMRPQGSGFVTERWLAPMRPNDLFAPLAHWAVDLFVNVNPKRVRKCDNCVGHFYDSSKKGTRRWCSMHLCGNRHKVAAYAARKRATDQRVTDQG